MVVSRVRPLYARVLNLIATQLVSRASPLQLPGRQGIVNPPDIPLTIATCTVHIVDTRMYVRYTCVQCRYSGTSINQSPLGQRILAAIQRWAQS